MHVTVCKVNTLKTSNLFRVSLLTLTNASSLLIDFFFIVHASMSSSKIDHRYQNSNLYRIVLRFWFQRRGLNFIKACLAICVRYLISCCGSHCLVKVFEGFHMFDIATSEAFLVMIRYFVFVILTLRTLSLSLLLLILFTNNLI